MNDSTGPCAGGEGRSVEGETLRPAPDKAIAFLRQYCPAGPWVLTAIPIERGPTKTDTFRPETEADARDWIQRWNGAERHQVYFMANPPMRDLDKKASKEDVRDMVALYVDIDPKKGEDPAAARAAAIARLEEFKPAPSILIDSGGGVPVSYTHLTLPTSDLV